MNATGSSNVARFLGQRAADQPEAAAVKTPLTDWKGTLKGHRAITFADLHEQSEQLSHAMVATGLRPGMRTLLMVRPGGDLIRCCFALFKVGAVPVVIDPGMGLRHFLQCVERTRPQALVGIPLAHFISRLFPKAFTGLLHRVRVTTAFDKWYGDFPRKAFPIHAPGPDDLAAILFTSGSTGPPKGVCYGHGQFDAQVSLVRETFSIQPGEVDLPMLPVFALFNPALGMTTVVPRMHPGKPAKVNPENILQAIRQCGVSNSFGSPVLWKKIGRHARDTGKTFPTVRRILMAGAPVPPSLVELLRPVFPNATVWSPYGATECLPVTAIDGDTIRSTSAERTARGQGTCVGHPVSGVSIKVIEIVDGPIEEMAAARELPVGKIGEIIATGPSVTKAYDALPEATRKAKIPDAGDSIWHRMGDAGYLDEEDRLWFCGRIAERVMTPDGPLYTDSCEGIFNQLPGVNRSALVGLGKVPGQRPAIVIETESGCTVDPRDVLEEASRHELTRGITTVFFSRAFPVDVRHNAKINRLELARQFENR